MRDRSGFSLMELLVVLAIVSIVAAVAIPTLIISRMTANEEAARKRCREIAAAQEVYASANGGRYADIAAMAGAGLLDKRFAAKEAVDGYFYRLEDPQPAKSFSFEASPLPGHGRYVFSIAGDRVVRFKRAARGFSLPPGIKPGDPVDIAEDAPPE